MLVLVLGLLFLGLQLGDLLVKGALDFVNDGFHVDLHLTDDLFQGFVLLLQHLHLMVG